jgi:hypothetical protein
MYTKNQIVKVCRKFLVATVVLMLLFSTLGSALRPAQAQGAVIDTPTAEPVATAAPEATQIIDEVPTIDNNILLPSPSQKNITSYPYVNDGSIWIVDKTSSPRQLTTGNQDSDPALSPNQEYVAFLSTPPQYLGSAPTPRDVCIVEIDTRDIQCITDTPAIRSNLQWSPDNTTLSYVEDGNLVLAGIDDRVSRVIATNVASDGLLFATPVWSPDGKTLTCILKVEDETAIWIIDPSSGPTSSLMKLPGEYVDVPISYSPKGDSILIVNAYDESRLWAIPLDGTSPKPVLKSVNQIYDFSYAPATNEIVYSRMDGSLWLANNITKPAKEIKRKNGPAIPPKVEWVATDEILLSSSTGSGTDLSLYEGKSQEEIQLSPLTSSLNTSPGGELSTLNAITAPFEWYRYQGESNSGACASDNCGPTTVAMSIQFAHNGQWVSISDIRNYMTGGTCGWTNLAQIRNALDHWGVSYTTITGMNAVRDAINNRGHIVIVPVIMSYIGPGADITSPYSDPANHYNRYYDYTSGHILIANGISQDGNWVTVQDPNVWNGNGRYWYSDSTAKGRGRYYNYSNFASAFANNGNVAIEITETPNGGGENHPPAGFTWCADEDGRCSFNGTADVVYGALNSFTSPRSFTTGVDCNNTVFGDPISGTRKACYYKPTSQPSGNLHVEYFNDKNLGSKCYDGSENSTYVFKNWGSSSPASGCNSDNFSARFTGTYNFPGGNYSFHCQHDDGCRISIDGVEKLNAWWDSSFTGHDWGGSLSGNHEVKIEFYDSGGDARLEAFWSGSGFLPSGPSCTSSDWCGSYFGNRDLVGTPAINRNEGVGNINYDWGTASIGYGFPNDNFSARWTRTVYFSSGNYRFYMEHDDGARLFIDDMNIPVLDKWTTCCNVDPLEKVMTEGNHVIKMEYYENGGGAVAKMSWELLSTPPSAQFDAWPLSGTAPFTTTMHIVNMTGITSCAWDYGDGQTSTTCTQLHDHTYNNAGTYTVSLTVTGPGGSNSTTLSNYITVVSPPPGAFNKSSPANSATNQSISVTLSWGSSTNATSYQYCYDSTNDNACSSWLSNGSATSKALSGLSAGTTYYWQVRAINSSGTAYSDGSASAFWSFTTAVSLPSAFNKTTPANGALGQPPSLTLGWSSSSGATSYQFCYDNTNDNNCSNWLTVNSGTSANIYFLDANTTYYWQIRAVNSGGITYADGGPTNYSYFTSGSMPGSFNKNNPANGAANQSVGPTLNWMASVGATSYEYCYDTTNDNACSNWVSNGIATSKTLSGLNATTTYYWQVRAVNSGGTTYANHSTVAFWSFTTGSGPQTFNLSVSKSGSGSGTITSGPSGINCGATCSYAFTSGTPVTLTATADTGSTFTGWSGGSCSGTGTCTVTMTAAMSVTANFSVAALPDLIIESITPLPANPQVNEAITFSVVVKNQSQVDASGFYVDLFIDTPLPVDCSGVGQVYDYVQTLAAGASQTLTLSYGGFGTGGSHTVNGIADTNCYVSESTRSNNTKLINLTVSNPSATLNVSKTGTGSGTITSSPTGINCGSTCSYAFAYNTSVTLTASPIAPSTFGGWSGAGCSGTGTCTVTMSAAQSVTAIFNSTTTTSLLNPSSNLWRAGGDDNGYEVNPANAYADDGIFAVDNNSGTGTGTSCTDRKKDNHLFYNYGMSLPGTAAIQGIEVRLDAKVDSSSGSPKVCVQLSWDGGSSWTTVKSTGTLTTGEQTFALGGPTDTWGHAWTPSQLSNANFRVRLIDVASNTSRDFSLDWISVRVTYK